LPVNGRKGASTWSKPWGNSSSTSLLSTSRSIRRSIASVSLPTAVNTDYWAAILASCQSGMIGSGHRDLSAKAHRKR
jgi:hypothetical protein